MRFAKPLTVLALATLPLGCPGDDTAPIDEESSSTGGESEGSVTNATTITTIDPDSSSSGTDPSATTTLTTTDPDTSTGSESESSTDPTATTGTDSSSSSTDPTTDTGSSTTDPTTGSTGASSESSTGTVASCADEDLGSAVPTVVDLDTSLADDTYLGSCGLSGGFDISYSWTAPADGHYYFTTSRPATAFDTKLYLLDTDCDGAELLCDDDAGAGATSLLSLDLASGQTVVVVVDGFNAAAFGAAELYIDVAPPAGDGGTCCIDQPGIAGCDTAAFETCVCNFDADCCTGEWDYLCSTEAATVCEATCPVPECIEPQDACLGAADDCSCLGCADDAACANDEDCTCADCTDQGFCSGGACVDDGSCNPYAEGCSCADCADEEVCAGIVPTAWTCTDSYYNSGLANDCDCGCGVVDPDCTDGTVDSCDFCADTGSCDEDGGGCPGNINADDNSVCDVVVPVEWTCSAAYYDSGFANDCDCGCGAFDPDCTDATVDSCDYCDDTGGCDLAGDCSTIDPDDNSVCEGAGPESEALTAGPGLAVAVVDDAYSGTLGSMSCVTLALAANGTDNVTGGQLQLGMSHTWVGDMTVKVVSPTGTVVTVLSRPGFAELADDGTSGAGDSSDLVFGSPLTYVNGGASDAELMGSTLTSAGVICQDDAFCSFDPNNGIATAGDFATFAGESAVGNWQVCVGDSAGGDLGVIDAVTLTIDQN